MTLKALSKAINRPSVTILAVLLSIWLGMSRFPFLQYLSPFGDFYIALLQICVLPFLLATIPLAVRSALTSNSAGNVTRRMTIWLIVTILAVALISISVPIAIFSYVPIDQTTAAKIGTLFNLSASRVDIEFALDPQVSNAVEAGKVTGLLAVIPTNVFFALSSNDSLRVVIFSVIFGMGMAMSERNSGRSIFGALQHIQAVCILIFDWFNVLLPIGIVALVAPQIALLGPDVFAILAPFLYAFLGVSGLLLLIPIVVMSIALRANPARVFAAFLQPLAMVAATRNALICAPLTIDIMRNDLKAQVEPCQLFIPIGFAVMRFGYMVHFLIATLFVGYLMGRTFNLIELALMAGFAVLSSFATIGVSGIAGLAPMAAVLRPFGLSYELALPLMAITDPIVSMIRGMLNVTLNSQIPAVAGGRRLPDAVVAVPAN